MTYNPEFHSRRSIRAKRYDYAQPGAYFVTICTWERDSVLGDVVDGEMRVNEIGALVQDVWQALPERFPDIVLDSFVVMPNHAHGIVMLGAVAESIVGIGEPGRACPARSPRLGVAYCRTFRQYDRPTHRNRGRGSCSAASIFRD